MWARFFYNASGLHVGRLHASLACRWIKPDGFHNGVVEEVPEALWCRLEPCSNCVGYLFKFGKHQGAYIENVPQDYLEWLVKDSEEKLVIYQAELARRRSLEEDQMPMMEKLILAGRNALALKHHPDKGGATADFQAVQAAYEQLRAAVRAVGGGE